jgi:hypothetical protein
MGKMAARMSASTTPVTMVPVMLSSGFMAPYLPDFGFATPLDGEIHLTPSPRIETTCAAL